MGGDKIFAPLCGVPLLARTVEVLLDSPLVDELVVVLRQERLGAGLRLARARGWPGRVRFCAGGRLRQDSVRLGLEMIPGEGWVLIHDGARPLLRPEVIARGLEAAAEVGAAVPGVPLADTVKLVSSTGMVEQTLPRERLQAVQTPQVFRLSRIRQAHRSLEPAGQHFSDDAALLEALGHPVAVFPGDPDNLKVTSRGDLQTARRRWREREKGHG